MRRPLPSESRGRSWSAARKHRAWLALWLQDRRRARLAAEPAGPLPAMDALCCGYIVQPSDTVWLNDLSANGADILLTTTMLLPIFGVNAYFGIDPAEFTWGDASDNPILNVPETQGSVMFRFFADADFEYEYLSTVVIGDVPLTTQAVSARVENGGAPWLDNELDMFWFTASAKVGGTWGSFGGRGYEYSLPAHYPRDNAWHTLVFTWNGTGQTTGYNTVCEFWLDGVLLEVYPVHTAWAAAAATQWHVYSGTGGWKASAIWDRVLTPSEIASMNTL